MKIANRNWKLEAGNRKSEVNVEMNLKIRYL